MNKTRDKVIRGGSGMAGHVGVHQDGLEEPPDLRSRKPGHLCGIKSRERISIAVALLENRLPTEPGLSSLEVHHLEVPDIVVDGSTPLAIVIFDVPASSRG